VPSQTGKARPHPVNLSQKLAENQQFLAWLDERIFQAELRRYYPPPSCLCSDPVVLEELRVLYVGHAKLLEHIQHLQKDLLELNFKETFCSVLETARLDNTLEEKTSGRPSFVRHLFPSYSEA
jgi:hypothetical protein